jgi:hypothetical protein
VTETRTDAPLPAKADPFDRAFDHTFLGAEGHYRIVLPPKVSACISRQRDALGAKNRRIAARAEAARRKAAGIKPGFLEKPGGRKKRRKASAGQEGGAA